MIEQKLRKCPFCGGEAEICREKGVYWGVSCKDCYASVGVYNCYKDKGEAIEAWNKRVPCDTCAMYFPDDGCMAGLAESEAE